MILMAQDLKSMKEYVHLVTDPRRAWGAIRHKLEDLLIIGFVTILIGEEGFEMMELVGRMKESWFRTFLELPNGIPTKDTFRRLYERLKPEEVKFFLQSWLLKNSQSGGRSIHVDGKTIRGSKSKTHKATHIVSAWIDEEQMTLGEVATEEKSNEITAIPELLDMLDIKGDTVTIDAMGCQTEIAKKIRKKGGDYILAVKGNQGNLEEEIKDYFEYFDKVDEVPEDIWESGFEKGHGRIEQRTVWSETDIDFMSSKEGWEDLKSIIRIRSRRIIDGEETITDRHFISSKNSSAQEFGVLIRKHWSVEAMHWTLDVTFREDASRVKKGLSSQVLNSMRKVALTLARSVKTKKKFSGRAKMLMAKLDSGFLAQLLFSAK
jgi:predicted transposase YbfD/YdcC